MPEYPDVELYLHALGPRVVGHVLTAIRLANPFLVRSVEPPIDACVGRRVVGLQRIGKRERLAQIEPVVWTMLTGLKPSAGIVSTTGVEVVAAGSIRWIDRGRVWVSLPETETHIASSPGMTSITG